jgi:Flp pilus assembly protein TadG
MRGRLVAMVSSDVARARLRGDEGAVVAEMALCLPFLVMIMAGICDFGVGFKDRTVIQGALRNSARTIAASGKAVTADQLAISTLWAGMSQLKSVAINRVVIFQADGTGVVPAICLTTATNAAGAGVAASECNIYSSAQVQSSSFITAGATCAVAGTGWDRFWCPVNRKDKLTDPVDYAGIYMDVTYTPFTRIFKSSITLTDKVITRLEPATG